MISLSIVKFRFAKIRKSYVTTGIRFVKELIHEVNAESKIIIGIKPQAGVK
jgi:hypothetical protein